MAKTKKKHTGLIIAGAILLLLVAAAAVFLHFGGFGTGESADPEAFAAYAGTVEDIEVPSGASIIALGEASHGNAEFQQLKLDVFKHMVETCGVRAFLLEGDFGGCEAVNRYIHGGEGTAREAAETIGFAIYRTDEIAALIEYMRQYNDSAAAGDDLRFYGFDMQRVGYNFKFLCEQCGKLGVDTSELDKLISDEDWTDGYDNAERVEIITKVKTELESKENSAWAVHFADTLLQNCELSQVDPAAYGDLRDKLMEQNVLWLAQLEREGGHERVFVSAHNGHVARYGSYDAMGKLLSDELGAGYYVIGTDFYRSCCNMPSGSSGSRTNQVFYSHDPLANAAKGAGYEICWLDFAKAADDPALNKYITDYNYMGSLGEGYSLLMRVIPYSYRIFQPPAQLYDGMIFVANANPTVILSPAQADA